MFVYNANANHLGASGKITLKRPEVLDTGILRIKVLRGEMKQADGYRAVECYVEAGQGNL